MSTVIHGRLGVAMRLECIQQYRYRFLHAGVFSGLVWLALLLPMPLELRSLAEPYMILGDLAIVGYFFVAGAVFFEKSEGTVHALVVTPLRFGEYLFARVALLTALSVVLAVVVATATHGTGYHLGYLLVGACSGTVLMLLASFISSMPFRSISDWFLPALAPLSVLTLPVFHYSGVWEAWWLPLIPTTGPLYLLGAAFGQVSLSPWDVLGAIGYAVLAAAGMVPLARWMFVKYVVTRTGGA